MMGIMGLIQHLDNKPPPFHLRQPETHNPAQKQKQPENGILPFQAAYLYQRNQHAIISA